MKKLALAILLLIAAPVFAIDGTISWTDLQNVRFERDRLKINAATCASFGLDALCTQAQARAAFCALPGSSSAIPPCVVNTVSSGTVDVYGGVADYLDRYVITLFFFPNLKQSQILEDKLKFDVWLLTATTEQKDAICLAIPLPLGCLP